MTPAREVDVLVVGFGAAGATAAITGHDAGAAGSIWGHLTEHGAGLTDAIVFGRIAGAQCATASAVAGALSPSKPRVTDKEMR